jgi:hypothetical protein
MDRVQKPSNSEGKSNYSVEICPSATLSTTNPTLLDIGSNPGLSDGKQATDCLNSGSNLELVSFLQMAVLTEEGPGSVPGL